jgi:S-(hydroxymethyl)glutathione dehydrogenase / alcohol dehydrogenase
MLTAKGGTVVITSVAPIAPAQTDVKLCMLAIMKKEIKGCLYGWEIPRTQIPRLLNLCRNGILKLYGLITETSYVGPGEEGAQPARRKWLLTATSYWCIFC